MLVQQLHIVLPADDALERRIAVKQGKGRNQPALTEDNALYVVGDFDLAAQHVGDFMGGSGFSVAEDQGAEQHTQLEQVTGFQHGRDSR
ncbi:MAG: hypothetical protein RRY35_01560 [Clostridiales bacterium]